jgi:hypothetical protein
MADDEGAAYWEGVYGQPIHVYERPGGSSREGDASGGGELEAMTDEEYATWVRQKMWEKTHAGVIEERARRAREREEKDRRAAEAARIAEEMERSLRRGEQRRRRREWQARWAEYLAAWAGTIDVDHLPWPTRSGDRSDIAAQDAVRDFFIHGLDLEDLGEKEFAARLKDERVRWHPDKIQQRLGARADESLMRDVTAIFQTIDKLWNDTRPKA